jgi:hypothetical protein
MQLGGFGRILEMQCVGYRFFVLNHGFLLCNQGYQMVDRVLPPEPEKEAILLFEEKLAQEYGLNGGCL